MIAVRPLRLSSRSRLGGKDVGLEAKGFEPFALNQAQSPIEPPLRADADNGGVFELTGGRLVVPAG